MIQKCKMSLYLNLFRFWNNVHFASYFSFLTHDVSRLVLNTMDVISEAGARADWLYRNQRQCFVGSCTHIL